MKNRVNLSSSDSEYTRAYEAPRGVDFSEIVRDGTKFAYLENMYVDYDDGADAVESIPGFRKIHSYGKRINAMHLQDLGERGQFLLIHSGENLYRFNTEERDGITDAQPIVRLDDTRSSAFSVGDSIYIMDGKTIMEIDCDGVPHYVVDTTENPQYIPTTYENGIKKDDRNLLTDSYIQKYTITSTDEYAFSTKGLTFAVNDQKNLCCSVTGIANGHEGALYIPATAVIDGIEYKVTEVATAAFLGNNGITEVYGGSNLEYIGKYAFKNCHSLEFAAFGNSLRYIDYSAFCNSPVFCDIYIGVGFEVFAEGSILNCPLERILYSGDDTSGIVGLEQFVNVTVSTLTERSDMRFGFKVFGEISTVDEVILDGEAVDYDFDFVNREVSIYTKDKYSLLGKELVIKGALISGTLSQSSITRCTVCTAHDGRIFLSGNPDLPGYVFYSRDNPDGRLFFSENDYFVDGVGNYPVTSLLSSHGTLTVFKAGDDGSGSIFCHDNEIKDGKTSYPLSYTHGGVSGCGSSLVISDDAVFLSDSGLYSIEKSTYDSRKLRAKSSDVDRRLLSEDISSVNLTEWCGYLVLSAGERFYLADARDRYGQGDTEYRWYYLNGIGAYSGGERVYKYSPFRDGVFHANEEEADKPASGIVMSTVNQDGTLSYFVEGNDGIRYSVYPTDEFTGGTFSPACFAIGVGKLLFFGTEGGDLCVFNNDKRGVAPNYIAQSDGFDPKEYAALMGNKIHPYYYTFDGRSVTYAIKTASDDCSVPHLAKSTVKHSLILKCKNFPSGGFNAEAVTDHGKLKPLGKYSMNRLNFNTINFENFDFSTSPYSIIPIAEGERGWVEKQLSFYSKDFRMPFGICSVTYRYRIKGKIKYS